jgi:exopolyphosphatase/guanosine-5'-triphosphate,3'-diphosphate pyrophosphatase
VTLARAACIDIGSNTTRLLVAEPAPGRPGALVEVAAHRAFVRLTAFERRSGIPEEKARAIADAVAEQALTARANDIAALRVVATAALRDAPGRDRLIARLSEAAGVPVEVLSGEEEARLAFAGATASLAMRDGVENVVVADVGGGSTELAWGAPGGAPTWWASLPIGSGALAEARFTTDPPSAAELDAARADAAAAIAAAGCPAADVAWAVGGSATSLRRLVGPVLDEESLGAALEAVVSDRCAAVARRFDLDAERVRLLPAGLAILEEAARAFGAPLTLGLGGLREGVVLTETP